MSSKSSTKAQLPNKSAWSRGPPQNTTAISANSTPTRSQSPAPQQTHSRRPSTLGQGVSVKDGVAVPRTVKTAAAPVTFGSINNDASVPVSSSPSPAVPPPTAASVKSDVVKSFGSVPAQHPNGTANSSSTTAPAASTAGPAASSSSANPTPPVASASASAPKLDKKDILKMFQNPSSSSSSSTPPSSNDAAARASPAPAVSSQPSASSTSTTSGSSNQPLSFTPPFVPSGSRPPPSSSSTQPPRSPVYSRQMPNGSGPRPQQGGPANNAAAGGPASPRLAPPNMQGPGAPTGAPPQGPPQMHPGMPPQPMPGWGYYPGMDPNQPYYVPYGWYVPQMAMPGHPGAPPPPGAHHPQHPNQHHPHPGQHPGPPGTPHGPPHSALPISPRAPPPNALPPGTPTTPHAVLQHLPHHPGGPHHGPHHGPHGHHSNQGSISVTSPPSTPASASASITSPNSASTKLNASSSAFVPGTGNRTSKIVFKNADGSEVDFNTIAKQSRGDASPGPKSATFPRQSSPAPTSQNGSAAGTPKRKSIRLESEEQRKARLDAEAKEKEAKDAEARKKKEKEEKERQERDAKEQKEREKEERRKKEEEDKKERERKKKEEEAKEEAARKKKIDEERERKKREAEEERERKKIEEAEKIKRDEEEKIRKQKDKEERKKREEAERERKKIEDEERKKREAEEEKIRQEREAEEQKRKAEEEEKAKAEAEKKAAEAAAAKAKADEEAPTKLTEEPEDGEIKETESPVTESAQRDPKSGLRINTGVEGPRRVRPDPLDLTGAKGPLTGPGALPSALATARNIESLESVQYPEGILSPRPELNKNVKDGFGFRYDRDFLLQFMKLCTEKPASLPPLHVLGLEPSGDQPSHHMTRTNSGRHGRNASGAMNSRQASIGLGISGSKFGPSASSQPFGTMGNFAGSGASKLSSEDRFAQSQRAASMSGGVFGGRPSPMQRTASQGGPGHHSNRTRSKRGEKRGEGNKAPSNLGPGGGAAAPAFAEPVAPLAVSANAWSAKRPSNQDGDSPEVVDRKVKSLLNKLTMEKFDSISDQIIQWANKSEKEKDGRTLIQVIRLVFEKATDEAAWSEMYARLCRKMMERISPQVQDDGIKNNEGKPITGGQLFRKYLLNRCQEDFERGWVNKEATAAAAASKAMEDDAIKQANEKPGSEEPVLYSDEYYAAAKAKRQGLGLIKFIGELFKLQMLTERIMHECVKKLLGNVDNPEEEEIESLCKLLTTVGQSLDTPKARAHMDVYFSRMKELTKSPNVSARMQFMLQDVLELRERKWVSRMAVAAPSTIAQVHENAAKEKALAEKEVYSRQISMSRGGSRRGGERGEYPQVGPDGWAVAGSGPSRAPPKAGDLSNFGKINKSAPMTFGPTSVFAGKNKEGKRESISRTNSSSNMFSMLQASEAGEPTPAKAPEPQRRRLVLQPRTIPTEGEADAPKSPSESSASEEAEAEEDAAPGGMTEEAAETKVKEDIKEFFAIRNLDEAEAYWTALPAPHHFRLVDKLLTHAVEAKETDAQLVADLFKVAVSKELAAPDAFEQGFVNIANVIEDIAIDAPKAVQFFGRIIKAAELDEERLRRLADKASEGHEDEGKEEYAERILKAIS